MKLRWPKVLLLLKESETEKEIICALYGDKKTEPVKIFMQCLSIGKIRF